MASLDESELGLLEEDVLFVREILGGQTPRPPLGDLPEGKRQILLVRQHHLFSANWLESAESGVTDSATVLLLTGKPSPSSDRKLRAAYVTFVREPAKLRRPSYCGTRGVLRLFMRYDNLPTVLAQVHEELVYCWVGHFGNGHLYGDIHTAHP